MPAVVPNTKLSAAPLGCHPCLPSPCRQRACVHHMRAIRGMSCPLPERTDVLQCAVLTQAKGNILWDCITVLDADTRARIRDLGGIRAIALSHPHYYSRMADWAQEFGATVYVHEADRQWVMQPSERVRFWAGARCRAFRASCMSQLLWKL